jgi:hypothetical protein
MAQVTPDHFLRAAADVGEHGDNDTLPFEMDTRFIKESQQRLAELAFAYYSELAVAGKKEAKETINSLHVFSERLLVPAGAAGFRISTKIHPFWNVYFNGLGIAIAEAHEPKRSANVHSYRFNATKGPDLFDRTSSWKAFREASIADCESRGEDAIVVQTDISSFYEHVYHHRIENCVAEQFPVDSTIPTQVDRLLNKFASGRSFGLPVGGQASRIVAEVLLSSVDRMLSDANVAWRRYVDDFVLITNSQSDAYRALSVLSHALADYGLTLNRTKTTFLRARHYIDYVRGQLRGSDDEAGRLRDIDLHFDPYSDNPLSDFEELKATVESLDVRKLLGLELHKGQPDPFLVSQVGRTLRLHTPEISLQLCITLLGPRNLHAFRASWSTIMRGVSQLRADDRFASIFSEIDQLLDDVPSHSPHLLLAEASCLHYLRTVRFRRTEVRAKYVLALYSSASSDTVRRACIDCWRIWKDRPSFIRLRNRWNSMSAEEQRMLWLAGAVFGDDGKNFRLQVKRSTDKSWELGIERDGQTTFAGIYKEWCANAS